MSKKTEKCVRSEIREKVRREVGIELNSLKLQNEYLMKENFALK